MVRVKSEVKQKNTPKYPFRVQIGDFHSFISSTVVMKLTGQDSSAKDKSQQARLVMNLTACRERKARVLTTAIIVNTFPKIEETTISGPRIEIAYDEVIQTCFAIDC